MNSDLSQLNAPQRRSSVRFVVLAFACTLSMITYLDRVCFGQVEGALVKEFELSDTQLGVLFTAFALAYSLFEVPSGWLGDIFGPRRTLIRIVLWWSLFTALTGAIYPNPASPWLAFLSLVCVRFLFGMGEAGAFPNIARALHNWFPFVERGSAQGAVWMAGRFMGGVTPFIVLALLQYVEWRKTFWFFGGLGLIWCAAFAWWFRDRPEQHPAVNEAELDYIRGHSTVITVMSAAPPHGSVPWAKILTNPNLWLLCVMYFCMSYGWYFNITWLPKYLRTHYDVTQDTYGFWAVSLMAGAPLLCGSLACICGGLLTDWFIRRTGDRKWGRRLFGVFGLAVCGICYFSAIFQRTPVLFVVAIALAAFFNDLTMGATWASALDIGKQYSGIVSGCMNTIGNLGGAVAGVLTGWILSHFEESTKHVGWQINFITYGSVYVVGVAMWLLFDPTKPVVPDGHD